MSCAIKLWVDYTNHDGKRGWRPIEPIFDAVNLEEYPPFGPGFPTLHYTMHVRMLDRPAGKNLRLLKLENCHEFRECEEKPE